MNEVMVRLAEPGDFEAVTALLAELGRPQVAAVTAEAAHTVYERHLADGETASLVAEEGGRVVGFLSLHYRERLNFSQPQAWVPDLIVTEAARGHGAGKALLQQAFALAVARGCDRVVLESGYTRTVAHRLYETAGMTNGGYYFTRTL